MESLEHQQWGPFRFVKNSAGHLTSLIHADDPHGMNWIREDGHWGRTSVASGIQVRHELTQPRDDVIEESFTFTNTGNFPIITKIGDLAIQTPLNDVYTSSQVCMTERCHAHLWCDGVNSYVMAQRMGGTPPHLGLVLNRGALAHYRIERDIEVLSNDRGIFWLLPESVHLDPGQSHVVSWRLFWYSDRADFFTQAAELGGHIRMEASDYVLFEGENLTLGLPAASHGLSVDDQPEHIDATCKMWNTDQLPIGPHRLEVRTPERRAHAHVLVLPHLEQLVRRRIQFIVQHQQCLTETSPLHGAYLTYDLEDHHQYYTHVDDHNAARERLGMGVLIARGLRLGITPSENLRSLEMYREFLLREIVDVDSGVVANDLAHNLDLHRLYNYAWMVVFELEMYALNSHIEHLELAARVARAYYRAGGHRFYPIELPMYRLITTLREQGRDDDADSLTHEFSHHVDTIIEFGTSYPPSEVNYEQSIVAPAASLLLDMYRIRGEHRYLAEAEKHLAILALFSGDQPHFQLHQTAIRHWDGYWFGKSKQFGDTFPHYWSALTGRAFAVHARLTGDPESASLARASLRGVLSMFEPDGRATCAVLFPWAVNDDRTEFKDPWANDQDWGLFFALDDLDVVRRELTVQQHD